MKTLNVFFVLGAILFLSCSQITVVPPDYYSGATIVRGDSAAVPAKTPTITKRIFFGNQSVMVLKKDGSLGGVVSTHKGNYFITDSVKTGVEHRPLWYRYGYGYKSSARTLMECGR